MNDAESTQEKDGRFSYDALPYPSFTFAQTTPDRLATMATFYGMEPAAPDSCRVLELGCGNGANLLSMAYVLGTSKFVGIDLSEVHIADAKGTADELSIMNVEFAKADVMDLDVAKLGTFDYIIAHGLFSWVPDNVRQRILAIYAECLAPQGVGYISYNAYPGCRLREMLWGMMQFHTRTESAPGKKVEKALELLEGLTKAVESESLYQTLLMVETGAVKDRSTSNVFHDDLSTCNRPFYFYEFAEMCGGAGLQFLSESDPASMNIEKLSPEGQEFVAAYGNDLIAREQYFDFVQNRRFRSTLVCRENVKLDREPHHSVVKRFYIASDVKPVGSETPIDPSPMEFRGGGESSLNINHPLTKAALICVGRIWIRSFTFDELLDECAAVLGCSRSDLSEQDMDLTQRYLVRLFQAGFVKMHRFRPHHALAAGEFPEASAFARWQIRNGSESVTTLAGLSLKPDVAAVRLLIAAADGTKSREELARELLSGLEVPPSEIDAFKAQLPELIESNLTKLAECGLLIE